MSSKPAVKNQALKSWIIAQAEDLGFAACGIAAPDTRGQIDHLKRYLDEGYAGNMAFLHEHHDKRADPRRLVENTQSIICVRMDYLTQAPDKQHRRLSPEVSRTTANSAIIARYARGRDYHKVMRGRLKQLAKRIEAHLADIGLDDEFTWRPFSDSAPIFEKTLAENAGLGWTGKHTLLINRQAGSFFVLGELFTSLELPFDGLDALQKSRSRTPTAVDPYQQAIETSPDTPSQHCGNCIACLKICPTQAIVAPYQLDARRCIAYQTIENKGAIPLELRQPIGNRIFGCDDCQLICPWNRFAKLATVADFQPRHGLEDISLLSLWQWNEATFLQKTEGSAIRRTGYNAFMRNVAIGLGNAPYSLDIVSALSQRAEDENTMLAEHVRWAIDEQQRKYNGTIDVTQCSI